MEGCKTFETNAYHKKTCKMAVLDKWTWILYGSACCNTTDIILQWES